MPGFIEMTRYGIQVPITPPCSPPPERSKSRETCTRECWKVNEHLTICHAIGWSPYLKNISLDLPQSSPDSWRKACVTALCLFEMSRNFSKYVVKRSSVCAANKMFARRKVLFSAPLESHIWQIERILRRLKLKFLYLNQFKPTVIVFVRCRVSTQ